MNVDVDALVREVPSAEQRCQAIRDAVRERGWTAELERIASMRVALAMQAAGLTPFKPDDCKPNPRPCPEPLYCPSGWCDCPDKPQQEN